MCDSTVTFLENKFGKSTSERGNGCPIYKTTLPEQYPNRETINRE